jgi:hypothetical protein
MATTQFIKLKVEPYIRQWLSHSYGRVHFAEKPILLIGGGRHKFDAVSEQEDIIASFVCNTAKTDSGNENTGGVRKAIIDMQYLNLLHVSPNQRLLVFTDNEFCTLIGKRAGRLGVERITFLFCPLPNNL